MRDLGGAALMVSVRDNDLKGRSSSDLTELAEVHGNPDNQDEHCLRSRTQDEPGGSEAAVNDCRTFIRGRVVEALDGLDAAGGPDPAIRAALPMYLALRGKIDVSLPVYYLRIGQAIHAVEDSFTHTYRTADGMKITAVMNWVDVANGTHQESRDGPAHATKMDVCNDPDALRTLRRKLATEASVALLRATLDPQQDKGRQDGYGGRDPRHVSELLAGLHLRQRLVQRAGGAVQGRGIHVLRLLVRRRRVAGNRLRAAGADGTLATPEGAPLHRGPVHHRECGRLHAGERTCRGDGCTAERPHPGAGRGGEAGCAAPDDRPRAPAWTRRFRRRPPGVDTWACPARSTSRQPPSSSVCASA